MWDVRVCTACLATDVRMYSMSAASLLEPYRLLTGLKLESEGMPQKLCWECAALVHKFNMFRHKCERASLLLQEIYNQHDEVSEEEVLRINREQHNLLSSYSTYVSPIEVYNSEFLLNTKGKKCHKDTYDLDCMAKKRNESQIDNVLNEPFIKLDLEIIKKEEVPIDMQSESIDTELIDEVFIEEDCPQAVQLESPQKIKRVRKRRRNLKPKQKSGRKPAKDFGMKEELLSQEQQMEVMREKQNTKAYKSARFPCTLCYNYFSEEKAFNNHMLKHDPVSGEFVCDICKLRYKTRIHLYGHIKTLHMKRYSCRSCPDVFYSRTTAQKHYAAHKGVVFTCRVCSATFTKKVSCQNHLRMKHPTEHVCDQCGEQFHSKKGLLCHINFMHKLKRDTVASGGEQETSGPYCAECDIQFTCKQAWTRHVLISPKHQHERHICTFGCEKCGETLPDKESLKAHRVTHRRLPINAQPIECEECDEVMETYRAYVAHFRRAHPGETPTQYPRKAKPCMCELCGQVFKYKLQLQQHSYKHTGEHPFKCHVCNKSFGSRHNLQAHGNTHTKELPYKCKICDRGFSHASNLHRHKTVHTNAKPYTCKTCGKGFKYNVSVKSHIQFVHMKKPWPRRDRSKRQNGKER